MKEKKKYFKPGETYTTEEIISILSDGLVTIAEKRDKNNKNDSPENSRMNILLSAFAFSVMTDLIHEVTTEDKDNES